ncbi:MAG TPA: formylglycine-generating enzyme family protein [Arcobacter sp.]|nr:formylglycine-generating enzyme family protein [Arcobacter sp.]
MYNSRNLIILIGVIVFLVMMILVSKQASTKEIVKFKEPLMVKISKGTFMMGTTTNYNSKPLHKVTIDYDFEIGVYEVTRKEYSIFSEEHKNHMATDYSRKKRCQGKDCPIVGISWYNAKAYVQWLSNKTGEKYRLPSESEWEYVARAGTTTRRFFDEEESDKYVWSRKNSSGKSHKVGLLMSNPWGVYDMYGNVWEWCEDWYAKDYTNVPNDGSANQIEGKFLKTMRGGSVLNQIHFIDADSRNGNNSPYTYSSTIGFRVVKELVAK